MDSREWMAVNPCDRDCEFKKKNAECVVKDCDAYIMYQERIATQKKLLQYLIFTRNYDYYIGNAGLITIASLIEMLEQLEETNG
jgi:hypothetical protein